MVQLMNCISILFEQGINKVEFPTFVDWALKGFIGLCVVQGVRILSGMKISIDELNNKMATIMERTNWHSKDIDRLEKRITRLEEHKCSIERD